MRAVAPLRRLNFHSVYQIENQTTRKLAKAERGDL